MLDMSYYFYINGYIYTTFALKVMSEVIQLMCNLVVVSCSSLHTKISNVTRISFSFEIYLLCLEISISYLSSLKVILIGFTLFCPFLLISQESRSNADDFFKDLNSHCPQEAVMQEQDMPFLRGGPGVYKVVKTGPSGHNIRSCPNLRGIPIGMLVLGNKVKAVGEVWILVASVHVFIDTSI